MGNRRVDAVHSATRERWRNIFEEYTKRKEYLDSFRPGGQHNSDEAESGSTAVGTGERACSEKVMFRQSYCDEAVISTNTLDRMRALLRD